MRVAVTDFFASYFVPSQQRGGILCPDTSLEDPAWYQGSIAEFSDPFSCARRLVRDIPVESSRLGIVCGSSKGDLSALPLWAEEGHLRWTPDFFVSQLAAQLRCSGPVLCPNAACATAAHALSLGAEIIASGRADVVLVGAVEWPQPPLILAAYRNMNALSKTGIMRPFDKKRDGFVAGAGFGFLVLESPERAHGRGAPIHGYLSGSSLKCDASHMTSMRPDGGSISRAIEDALRKAGNPRPDYINAHGTATRQNDLIESRAIHAVFGSGVPLSSTKAQTGHLLGAAGAVEAAICLLTMQSDFAPPTLNLHEPDTGLELDYLAHKGRKMRVDTTLSLNYGFGGHIGALVLERSEPCP